MTVLRSSSVQGSQGVLEPLKFGVPEPQKDPLDWGSEKAPPYRGAFGTPESPGFGGVAKVSEPSPDMVERLASALDALETIAHPAHGLGFNKLRGLARAELRRQAGMARETPACRNCGSTRTMEAIRAGGFIACCPERDMRPGDAAGTSSDLAREASPLVSPAPLPRVWPPLAVEAPALAPERPVWADPLPPMVLGEPDPFEPVLSLCGEDWT